MLRSYNNILVGNFRKKLGLNDRHRERRTYLRCNTFCTVIVAPHFSGKTSFSKQLATHGIYIPDDDESCILDFNYPTILSNTASHAFSVFCRTRIKHKIIAIVPDFETFEKRYSKRNSQFDSKIYRQHKFWRSR